ncbi:MAG TPA: hypothetical protein IAC74_04675 [Candidatus Aphodoplasma excrementigallinarum]|uniref:DivIVA domain-containing protein n=1 Tax=Candidatus Aphodoplasma excrementigallinarum TaxID=2840673 RepID=A0A9D1T0A4_9FIRM|nr:hypothetical protein [Candidatus Aphodoplasma excrementigallinarum]
METEKKFRKTLFGYRKKDVNAYIMDTAREFDKKKKQFEAEAADQAGKYKDLQKKYNALDSKAAALEKERTYIADALLDAKQEAEKIVADAKVEAARMRSDLEVELEKLRAEVRSEQVHLKQIRAQAKETLEAYIGKLADIDMKIDAHASGNEMELDEWDGDEEEPYIPEDVEDDEDDGEEDDFEFELKDIEP